MRWPATPSATWTPSRWASTPTARRSCCATSGPGTRKSRPVWTPAWTPPISRATSRRRRPTPTGMLAAPRARAFLAAGLHHPAPSALRGAGRRQPARPVHGPSAAGAGRRRHHRPHLAGQRHSARQPGGRFPGGARRDRRDLNVFASRRGNWEVMLRAAFHSRSLVNLYAPVAPVAHTLHAPRARRCRCGRPPRATATPGCQ